MSTVALPTVALIVEHEADFEDTGRQRLLWRGASLNVADEVAFGDDR